MFYQCKLKGNYKVNCYKYVCYPPEHYRNGYKWMNNDPWIGYDHKYNREKMLLVLTMLWLRIWISITEVKF